MDVNFNMSKLQDYPVIQLHLRLSEVNDILKILGDLPTKSNAYPLMLLIKDQAEKALSPPVDSPTDVEG